MATAASAELMRRLGAHGSMLTRQRALVEAARSAVMDPDDAAIAEIKMRGRITDAIFVKKLAPNAKPANAINQDLLASSNATVALNGTHDHHA